MLSVIDVVGGSILAYILYWFQWTFKDQFDGLFTAETIIPSKCILSLDMEWNSNGVSSYSVDCSSNMPCLGGITVRKSTCGWMLYQMTYIQSQIVQTPLRDAHALRIGKGGGGNGCG